MSMFWKRNFTTDVQCLDSYMKWGNGYRDDDLFGENLQSPLFIYLIGLQDLYDSHELKWFWNNYFVCFTDWKMCSWWFVIVLSKGQWIWFMVYLFWVSWCNVNAIWMSYHLKVMSKVCQENILHCGTKNIPWYWLCDYYGRWYVVASLTFALDNLCFSIYQPTPELTLLMLFLKFVGSLRIQRNHMVLLSRSSAVTWKPQPFGSFLSQESDLQSTLLRLSRRLIETIFLATKWVDERKKLQIYSWSVCLNEYVISLAIEWL